MVANRYQKGLFAGGIRQKEAEKALGRPFDALVPSDFKTISEAINVGIAVTEVKRRSPIAKSLRQLWDRLLKDLDEASQSQAIVLGRGD